MERKRETPQDLLSRADMAWVLSDARGRRVLWRVIAGAGVWDRIRAPNPDIHYREGRRDVGIELMERIDSVDNSMIPLMMQEARNQELLDDRRR